MNLTSAPTLGYDTWVDSANPNTPHASGNALQLKSGAKIGLLWMPLPPHIRGATVSSAPLTLHAHGVLDAQTITIKPIAGKWQADKKTFANQPATRAGSVSVTIGALTDGAEVVVDIASLVQQVADGQGHYGWQITTDATATQKLRSFDAAKVSHTLEVNWAEDPEPPTGLSPDGTVVGVPKPVVKGQFTEFGSAAADLANVRVQVDYTGDGISDWDSGYVVATNPSLDLAGGVTLTPPTSGQTYYWRMGVKDDSGRTSAFSDWATWTYVPPVTVTLDSPAAGVMYDPTSDILAHITGGTLAAYRIWVTDGDDRHKVRYDSKKQLSGDPANIAFGLPLRNDDGSRIFTDDRDYQIGIRVFDTQDREATPGSPAHVDLWTTVHFDDDLALDPVTSFQVKQIDNTPFTQLTWTDVAAGDAYLISRDDVHIARVTPADVVAGVSTYTTVDQLAAPYVDHVYSIRRITVGVGRSKAVRAPITTTPVGVWLLRDNGDSVWMKGVGIDQLVTAERRSTFAPVNLPYTVDLITGLEGISGPLALTVKDETDQSIDQALRVLGDIKDNLTEPVRLIAANISKPVLIKNLTVLPHPDFDPLTHKHRVEFTVTQVGEFDHRLG